MKIEYLWSVPGTDICLTVEAERSFDKGDYWTPDTESFDVLSIKREDGREVNDDAILRLVKKMFPDEADKFDHSWLDNDLYEKASDYYEYDY